MSGTYPSSPGFERFKIRSWQPTFVSLSHSLKRQVRSRGGAQRWEIQGSYNKNLSRDEIAPIFAFLMAQRGQYEPFTLIPPDLWADARGVATGTPKIAGGTQTGRTINTDGWTADTSGILLRASFIKFSGHDKVYMVTADADADADGAAAITIEPALLESPADNEDIVINNVPFLVSCTSDMQEFDIEAPDFHGLDVSFVEVI